jgi:O-antigen ligase
VNASSVTTLRPSRPGGDRQVGGGPGPAPWSLSEPAQVPVKRTSLAYVFLCCFVLIYWARPNYWVPGASGIPFAKITGALAIASFFLWFFLERKDALSLPREMVFLLLLYIQMCLAIPFSVWRGGSFDVVIVEYSKVVAVTMVAMMTITSFTHLRRLIFIQTATVLLMVVLALSGHGSITESAIGGRLGGTFGGTYANPNDFALDLALIFPFAFAFLLTTSKFLWKAFWLVSMGLLVYTVLATLSRGGLLALLVGAVAAIWEFAVKGRRHHWIFLAVIGAALVVIFAGPAGYAQRVSTIFHPDEDVTGSSGDRRVLLDRGIRLTEQHPFFGVGPGQFQVVSGQEARDWHVAHNTYVEMSSEAGIPALILFLLIVSGAFSSLRRGRKLVAEDVSAQVLIGAVRASLLAFAVGAMFADTAYQFFPYFLFAYAVAILRIAQHESAVQKELDPVAMVTHNYA